MILRMKINFTHNMGLQVSNGYTEWPDVLPESLWVHCPSLPTSSCTCWLFGWVALHEEECPKQMKNLSFMGEEETLYYHCPQLDHYFSTATKKGAKSVVF